MDMGDFFRSVFGLRRKPHSGYDPEGYHNRYPRDISPDERDHDHDEGGKNDQDINEFSFFFGNSHGNLDDMFQHFHGDMFRQMESLHRQMDEMMRGFGAITSEHSNPFDNPPIKDKPKSGGKNDGNEGFTWFFSSPPQRPEYSRDPRDFMLKDREEESPKPNDPTPSITPPQGPGSFSFKHKFPSLPWKRSSPENRKDTDLDDKISQGDVLDLIKKSEDPAPAQQQPTPNHHGSFSYGSSFSMTTIQGPDGRVEHKKVVRDSSGREKTTVTRSIGDQTHIVTTTSDESGHKEHHEDFKNMDEGDVKKFEEKWNWSDSSRPIAPNAPADPSLYIDSNDRNLFARLFGGSW